MGASGAAGYRRIDPHPTITALNNASRLAVVGATARKCDQMTLTCAGRSAVADGRRRSLSARRAGAGGDTGLRRPGPAGTHSRGD
ncbi:hypothetical protein EVAR_44547_1 [Eumeta japonica]|uniref:Uncharacterized protein n=1 Tax=Eumeta variegata TaxID=151549 RepID=A0A4C1X7V7_EUMVA|nr:hypothetical protein EVAR_44547_1 [Eumeta japonica]